MCGYGGGRGRVERALMEEDEIGGKEGEGRGERENSHISTFQSLFSLALVYQTFSYFLELNKES